jgi:hypothetical protein
LRHLSEDIIKRAGIRFLKEYYKFRPRLGSAITAYDQSTDDGIITDGQFSFISEDGSPFLATLEATSHESRAEVMYDRQEKLLFWDSFVSAVFIAVFFFTLSHYSEWVTVDQEGWLLTMLSLLVVLSLGFLLSYWIIRDRQRYRYIYGVEQFKKYHADEQWIAIADDVFDEDTDQHYQELKTQCVYNGFGLLSVDELEEARIIITPSRQEVFGHSRANAKFSNRDDYQKKSKTATLIGFWNRIRSKFSGKSSSGNIRRYERSFASQYLLILIGVGILSAIFYKEALNAPIKYVNEDKYEAELLKDVKDKRAETDDFYLDSAYVENNNPNVKPYLEEVALPVEEEDWESAIEYYFEDAGEQHAEIYISSGDGQFLSYDCERFFNYEGTKFLIQESTYESVDAARRELIRLKGQGISANCLWTGCFEEEDLEFIIFIDFLFDERNEASLIANNITKRLKLNKNRLKIRSITL